MRVLPDSRDDNPLKQYYLRAEGNLIHKWHHYFDIYDNHFSRFRGKSPVVLEIGVYMGGSLQMWKNYFGEGCKIVGIDINKRCKELEEDGIDIHIGDQVDRNFLRALKKQYGAFDIVIDDGSHAPRAQSLSFDELFDAVQEDGVYLIEDTHLSYWMDFNNSRGWDNNFLTRAKTWVDSLHAYHSRQPDFVPDGITKAVTGLHFYDSVVVLEKCKNPSKPLVTRRGRDPFSE